MIRSLNTATTGMKAQQQNMDVIAHNMANASTFGFKKGRAEFEDLLYQQVKEPGEATGLNAVSPLESKSVWVLGRELFKKNIQ